MKRVLTIILALMTIGSVSLWAAGGTGEKATAEVVKTMHENSWENYKDEPITLDVYVDDNNMDPEILMAYETLIPKLMREQTGVALKIRAQVDDTDQTMNLIIASEDYPDLMFARINRPYSVTLVENDQIWAYDDLREKYGIDVISHMNINQRFRLRSTFMNPKIYFATAYGFHDEVMDSPWLVKWQTGAYINEPLYQAVGSPPINSFDDLMNTAQKIKEKFPRVEFPINITRGAGPGEFNEPQEVSRLKMYYGLNDPTTYWKLGEPHKFFIQAPGFVDLVADLNEMVARELISPIVWTGTKNDKLNNVFTGVACFEMDGDGDNFPWYNDALKEKVPGEYYVMLPPFSADPAKYRFTAAGKVGSGGSTGWVIPKSTPNTLRVLAFVDYVMSNDFQKLNVYGREGIEHTLIDGVPVMKPEIEALGGTDIADEYYFNVLGGAIRDNYWQMIARQQRMPEMKEAIDILRPAVDDYKDLTFVPEAAAAGYPEGSEEIKIYAEIKEAFGDELMRIILGPPDRVRVDLTALLSKVEGMGLGKLNLFQEKVAKNFSEVVEKYRY